MNISPATFFVSAACSFVSFGMVPFLLVCANEKLEGNTVEISTNDRKTKNDLMFFMYEEYF
ncbi:MAG: hypothetical protein ACKPAD_10815, partial [Bacteroidota bacterium]